MGKERSGKQNTVNYAGIGKRIKDRRKKMKISQNKLAEMIGLSSNHLSSIENGKQGFSIEVLIAICTELKVSPDYLLLGNMHSYNIPLEITETLKLCSDEDVEYFYDTVNLLVARNTKGNISEKYLKRLSVYKNMV